MKFHAKPAVFLLLVLCVILSQVVAQDRGKSGRRDRTGKESSSQRRLESRSRSRSSRRYTQTRQRSGRFNFGSLDEELEALLDELRPWRRPTTTRPDVAFISSKPPRSRQRIRFSRVRSSLNSGLLEVYRAGKWGVICDDSWDISDAAVACKQLGFKSGAESADVPAGSASNIQQDDSNILMDEVSCTGKEERLQQCLYSTNHDCSFAEAAGVTCNFNKGCPTGWLSGFGKCYKFHNHKSKGINAASRVCQAENATLLTIDSVEENHFISNALTMLSSELKDSNIWFTGGRRVKGSWKWFKQIMRVRKRSSKSSRVSWKTLRSNVEEGKWLPAWPGSVQEPVNKRYHDCLVLANEVVGPYNVTLPLNYYFWRALPCRARGGIRFVCQRDIEQKQQEEEIEECYRGRGEDYRGEVEITETGSICLPWSESLQINNETHPNKGLGDHNYCRNPDGDLRPWCWVNTRLNKYGYCGIPECSQTTPQPATTTTTTTALPDLDCPSDEFYCSRERVCVPESFRCDKEQDCSYGEDEKDCEYSLQQFEVVNNTYLVVSGREYEMVTWLHTTEETCAQKCVQNTDFVCRSFIYDESERKCILSVFNSLQGILLSSTRYNYYELSSQKNCTGKHVCANGLCVELTKLCDGVDDCHDLSDEIRCSNSSNNDKPVTDKEEVGIESVRLVGGEEHSGTVEITYKGTTGVICDDVWDVQDGHVICRMLGYPGALGVTSRNNYQYQSENSVFLLDNVECFGNETTIADCPSEPWKTHDCRAYEIAGVECQKVKGCEEEQFQCVNKQCVNPDKVCNRDDDCGDNSDESFCSTIFFRLVNGSRPWEGRVEISRNGVAGSVCNDQWDDSDAGVICMTLGYKYGGKALNNLEFGAGKGPIWMDNVQCQGRERFLYECEFNGWAQHDCDHSEDVGVRCYPKSSDRTTIRTSTTTTTPTTTTTTPTTTASTSTMSSTSQPSGSSTTTLSPSGIGLKLVGGKQDNEGNVEVIVEGNSYRICDDEWDLNEANVICRMLGYKAGGIPTKKSFFGTDSVPILFDDVECSDTDTDFGECKAIVGKRKHDCDQDEFAGVICTRQPNNVGAQTSPATDIEGQCGIRPYDYTNLHGMRRRRSASSNSSLSAEDQFTEARVEKIRTLRLHGGNFADHGAYPWQVGVRKVLSIRPDGSLYSTHHCGAVIISEHWLLSAAHCFHQKRKSQFRVVVGDHHHKEKDKGEQMFEVEELILHEYYQVSTIDYDIALIKIKTKGGRGIQFSNYVQPVCLPTSDTPYKEGTMCMISGWGSTESERNKYPDTLKEAKVPLISDRKCRYLYNPTGRTRRFTARMMCAGYSEGGIDTCDGDSGGPLVCNIGGVYTVLGVTSWGNGCGKPLSPGIYAKVGVFLQWINAHIVFYGTSKAETTLPRAPIPQSGINIPSF